MQEAHRDFWKRSFYGTATPSRGRRIVAPILLVLMIVFCYGMATEFVPSAWWSTLGSMIALGVAVPATRLVWWCLVKGWFPLIENGPRPPRWLAVTCTPPLIWLACWSVVARAVPDAITRLSGSPTEVELTLKKEDGRDRRGCNKKVRGPGLNAFPWYICVPPPSYDALPDQGPMLLVGRSSGFGLHVEDIKPAARRRSE